MNGIDRQRECLANDAEYSAYFHRFFSVRQSDGSIPPVEIVTQDVLVELERLARAYAYGTRT